MPLFIKHLQTQQLAKLHRDKLILIKKTECAFTMPGSVATTYEITVIENISEQYVSELCRTNVVMAKKTFSQVLTKLINDLLN